MKIKNRILAGVSAAIMAVGVASVLPVSYLSASAIQIPAYSSTTGKISEFSYSVSVEKLQGSQLKVTFKVLNNPGLTSLGIAIHSDATFVDGPEINTANVPEKGNTATFYMDTDVTKRKFEWEYIYDISSNPNKTYDFSLGIAKYESPVEGINYQPKSTDQEDIDEALSKGVSFNNNLQNVVIGDANNDKKITLEDANIILNIVGKCEKNSSDYIYTAQLNKYLKSNYDGWKTQFPLLTCAEAIDVNFDGKITETDSNDVLVYYSKVYAGSQIIDTLIGTKKAVTVVYNN